MNTIITIGHNGTLTSIVTIPLDKKLHNLHPEATRRITIFTQGGGEKSSHELPEIARMHDDTGAVLQVTTAEHFNRVDRKQNERPDYYMHEIDLRY